ncbi:hypothetical protein [Marinithermus hydrothermalis]|uniref:Uncharacterized protein n=1 Tax=Marinithermus hydrothermalis (strain DSM 14884 / JCM 11576 / T1) TaxID=869210 RepID=F2NMI9_MARHT|nr:hypothetical protein [Marinithermus hydrothermalis]AEB12159.1 hypothetical protein Marky_1424 [Marinithermus hydrothermalis DSM 14884]
MRRLAIAWLILAGLALAHAEPVTAKVTLWISDGYLHISAAFVGEQSEQPVLDARVEALLLEAGASLPGGTVRGRPQLSGIVARQALREATPGVYTARIASPPTAFLLVLADTSFSGETALASAPVRLPLPTGGAVLTLVFPATATPTPWLTRALAWLWLPVALGAGLALAAQRARRVYSRKDA